MSSPTLTPPGHDTLVALVRASPLCAYLEPLPAGVRLVSEPDPEVEFALIDGEFEEHLEIFDRLPALRIVQVLSAGIDWLTPSLPEGVAVCDGRGLHDTAVAEWVVASLLTLQRRLPEFWSAQGRGRWERSLAGDAGARVAPGDGAGTLEGKTVLIVGFGSIGRAVSDRLAGFGVTLVCVARRPRPGVFLLADLPELLPQADAVILLLPLVPETDGLVDARFLACMKPGAILINAGRGRVVRTDALVEAAARGRVRAALDVTEPEPLPDGHPLWAMENVLVTPHIAGEVKGWQVRAYRFVREQLHRCAAGEPLLNRQDR